MLSKSRDAANRKPFEEKRDVGKHGARGATASISTTAATTATTTSAAAATTTASRRGPLQVQGGFGPVLRRRRLLSAADGMPENDDGAENPMREKDQKPERGRVLGRIGR